MTTSNVQTQDPTPKPEQWLQSAYSWPLHKRVSIRPPTAIERQNGEREVVRGEILTFVGPCPGFRDRDGNPVEQGRFYDAHGRPVDDRAAAEAGYDVRKLRLAGEKHRKLAEAKARIEAEFQAIEARIEQEPGADAAPAPAEG